MKYYTAVNMNEEDLRLSKLNAEVLNWGPKENEGLGEHHDLH